MLNFSPGEQALLIAIFDTLVPRVLDKTRHPQDFWRRKGSELLEPEDMAVALENTSPATQKEFKQLLFLMQSPLLGLTWNGPLRKF